MKNPFANYSKDTTAKVTAACIVVFLILVVIAAPEYWPWCLLALIGYAALFYFMRNNP